MLLLRIFDATAVADMHRSAVLLPGLVTFIASYHYFRIFSARVEAYSYAVTPSAMIVVIRTGSSQ